MTTEVKNQTFSLQIDDDVAFQKVFWVVQRIGWTILSLIVIFSLFGLTGFGVLSQKEKQQQDVHLQYQTFERNLSPAAMQISFPEKSTDSGSISLAISTSFLNNYEVQSIVPEPESVSLTKDSYQYEFPVKMPGDNATITFYLEPQTIGFQQGVIRVADTVQIPIEQFIYP